MCGSNKQYYNKVRFICACVSMSSERMTPVMSGDDLEGMEIKSAQFSCRFRFLSSSLLPPFLFPLQFSFRPPLFLIIIFAISQDAV